MLNKLRLERVKNFKNAELILGPLTLLVGTNASGKSNIRDAFRFLHGISRGYKLAEIIGEKYVEGGVLQWRGIRGGTREIAFQGENTFALEASFSLKTNLSDQVANYRIEVDLGTDSQAPSLISERLTIGGQYDSFFEAQSTSEKGKKDLIVNLLGSQVTNRPIPFSHHQPIISQLAELSTDIPIRDKAYVPGSSIKGMAKATLQAFSSMRFLDLSPIPVNAFCLSLSNALHDLILGILTEL